MARYERTKYLFSIIFALLVLLSSIIYVVVHFRNGDTGNETWEDRNEHPDRVKWSVHRVFDHPTDIKRNQAMQNERDRRRSSSEPSLIALLNSQKMLPRSTSRRRSRWRLKLTARDLLLLLVVGCTALPALLLLSGGVTAPASPSAAVGVVSDREDKLTFQFARGDCVGQLQLDQRRPFGAGVGNNSWEETGGTAEMPQCQHTVETEEPMLDVDLVTEPECECEIEKANPSLGEGGRFRPSGCHSEQKVAIVVPYRDRNGHLKIFLQHMHRFLQEQKIDYQIFIVEQIRNQSFNRGKLLNVGFTEARKLYDFNCIISHDVDLLPENLHNLYVCDGKPRHMSAAIRQTNYKLTYKTAFGGVNALSTDQFLKLNGYSNNYWNWGKEDDDLSKRLKLNKMKIARYNQTIAKYTMMGHTKFENNPPNYCNRVLHRLVPRTWRQDGLNSLEYNLLTIDRRRLYVKFTVDLQEQQSYERLKAHRYYDTSKKKKKGKRPVITCYLPSHV